MEKDFVREIADLYSARFHHLAEIGIVKEMSFEIDSKDFEDKYRDLEDVRYATPFKMMFEQLAEVDELPCLYRWEITSPYDAEQIKQTVSQLPKYTPRVLKKAVARENTLYVGKVQSHIVGRVIQHLGYHLNQASHGLQLNDWAKNTNLIFKLYVYFFPIKYKEVMPFFEKALADEMHPLIGTHYI
jgi:hypothetical protein